MKRPYALAVGRCPAGLDFEGKTATRILFASSFFCLPGKAKNYLSFLASLARSFHDSSVMDQSGWLGTEMSLRMLSEKPYWHDDRPARRRTKFNKLLTDEASKIAKAAECSTILVFTDVFPPSLTPRMTFPNFKVVLAGEGVSDEDREHHRADATLAVRSPAHAFLNYGQLFFWAHRHFWLPDRVCCIGGIPGSGQFDTVLVVDVDEEFESVIGQGDEMLPRRFGGSIGAHCHCH